MLGAERRRRWSYDEKVRLVEETLQPGETVCGVARRHGVTHSLPFTWRRQARQGDWAEMLRLLLFPSRSHLHGHRHRSARRNWRLRLLRNAQRTGIIEIELSGGCRVRVDRDVDVEALQQVLELLRGR